MKQNLVAGLVFGAALLIGARLTRTGSRRRVPAGSAARPWPARRCRCSATVGWALVGGRPDLDDAVVRRLRLPLRRDRRDRHRRQRDGPLHARAAPARRSPSAAARRSCWPASLIHRRRIWRLDRTLTVATAARGRPSTGWPCCSAGASGGRTCSRSCPGLVLCTALLLAVRTNVAARARVLVGRGGRRCPCWRRASGPIADLAGLAGVRRDPDRSRRSQRRGRARRHDRGVRRPRRRSCSPAAWRRRTSTCGACRCAPSTRTSTELRGAARRPGRAHLGRDVGAGVGVGRPGRDPGAGARRAVPAARADLRRQAGLPARRTSAGRRCELNCDPSGARSSFA